MPPREDDPKLQARRKRFLRAFGEMVRTRRKELGLTQKQLDGRMGYRGKFVGGIEQGARNITLDTLYALAAALGTDPRDLLGAELQGEAVGSA